MSDNYNNDEYEKVCSICRRTESRAGRMFNMLGGMYVCEDCLKSAMEQVNSTPISMEEFAQMANMFNTVANNTAGNNKSTNDVSGNNKASNDAASTTREGRRDNAADDSDMDNAAVNNVTQDGVEEKAVKSNNDGDRSNEESADDKKKGKVDDSIGGMFPNFGFSFGFPGEFSNRNRVKKADKKPKKDLPELDINKLLPPHEIKAKLDEYVIGQEHAKKVISVAVYNHYKRVLTNPDDIELEKSNMLMIGPTGAGKTYLVRTLARILQVPLAITDATSLTEAGYIGDDIESVVSKLLMAADNDVERAEKGIIFIDEIDKIAKKKETRSRDVSGESVQQGLLKLLEGSEVEVPVGATSKNAMVPMVTVNTKNILFICGGAFPDLEDIIKQRLNKQSAIGFNAELKDAYDKDGDIFAKVETEDLREFGMIPEFLGRLPIVYSLSGITKEMLVRIMKEPKNAIINQYKKLLDIDEVKLEFDDDALEIIAEKALERNTGARALRSILEEYMLDIMYEIPKDSNIGTVTITRDYIANGGMPRIEMRGEPIERIALDNGNKEN